MPVGFRRVEVSGTAPGKYHDQAMGLYLVESLKLIHLFEQMAVDVEMKFAIGSGQVVTVI